jgi:hypothetical protein
MDISVHSIKAFVSLAPKKHTATKTMRAPRAKRGQALYRVKAPPDKRRTLCGLLNANLMAVDFTSYRETGRLFLLMRYLSVCCFHYGWRLIHLSAWQCYIAKYP